MKYMDRRYKLTSSKKKNPPDFRLDVELTSETFTLLFNPVGTENPFS